MKTYLKATDSMIKAAMEVFKTKNCTSNEDAIRLIIEAALLQKHKDKISAAMRKSHEKRKAAEHKKMEQYIKSLNLNPSELRKILINGLRTAA